jgi:hypothetical protein
MLWALALFACDPGRHDSGTAVGNPGKLGVVVTDVPTDIDLLRADVSVDHVLMLGCDGVDESVEVSMVLDALQGNHTVDIPGGEWCGLTMAIDPAEAVILEGTTDGGTTFNAQLDPGTLGIDGRFLVDGDLWLLGLPMGGILESGALEAAGDDVELSPPDTIARDWADQLADGVGLFNDSDEDGFVDDGEDAVDDPSSEDTDGDGIDSGEPADTDTSDEVADAAQNGDAGCGCGSVGALGSGWLVLLLALAFRRRS